MIDPKMLRGALNVGAFVCEPAPEQRGKFFERVDSAALLRKALRKAAFEPINPAGQDERAAGFVEFETSDATEFARGSTFFPPTWAVFTWRVDTLKVPGAVLKKALSAWAKNQFYETHSRPPGRRERAEQKLMLKALLRTKQEPATKLFPVALNEKTGELYVFGASAGVIDEVEAVLAALLVVRFRRRAVALLMRLKESVALEAPPENELRMVLEQGSLGRSFLTWLLFMSESTEPVGTLRGAPVSVVFEGKTDLAAVAGEVTTARFTGATSPYSPLLKHSLQRGLFVDSARLRITVGGLAGDLVYAVTVDAQTFTLKGLKLPAVVRDDPADQLVERIDMAADVAAILADLVARFAALRLSAEWPKTVDALVEWMNDA